jgi:hypothetical protein
MDNLEKNLWKKTNRYCRLLRWVPFLRFVGVCNSLAFSRVNAGSDIDLFIIAKTGRLFIVRSIVTLIFQVLGVRRHGDKVAGRFCLSFFVDDEHLDLSEISIERDIYLAFWVRSMKPVLEDGVYQDFVSANSWIDSYFEDIALIPEKNGSSFSKLKGFFEFVFFPYLANIVESILARWQLKRARLRASSVIDCSGLIVRPGILKFHNIDRRAEYRGRWEDKYGEGALLSPERFLSL